MIMSNELRQDIIDMAVNAVGTQVLLYIMDDAFYNWLARNFSECELRFLLGDE